MILTGQFGKVVHKYYCTEPLGYAPQMVFDHTLLLSYAVLAARTWNARFLRLSALRRLSPRLRWGNGFTSKRPLIDRPS